MQCCRPGLYEYQLAAEIEHEFTKSGCRSPAYPTIVASGANACILHHPEKHDMLQDGDLVLIDAGAELDYYASDITRTYPVNGRFNKQQKIIYELVLKAQKAAIQKVYAGNLWIEPYDAAIQVITEGLRDLGILVGQVDFLIQEEAYKKFYMHRIGHWLGMDVHDGGVYKVEEVWRKLEPGMVMTVEPGIYIPALPEVPQEWWNIGVRIEDNVLITEGGHEVLTANLPKTVWEIEEFMATNQAHAQSVYGYDESGYDTGGMAEKPDLLVRSRSLVDDDKDPSGEDATDFDFGN
jgi:Xaa-Pro aminopeptidase